MSPAIAVPALDRTDLKILDALQANGRLTNAELAERVGLSLSPCWRRLKRLEESGVITGYQALLDRPARRPGPPRGAAGTPHQIGRAHV